MDLFINSGIFILLFNLLIFFSFFLFLLIFLQIINSSLIVRSFQLIVTNYLILYLVFTWHIDYSLNILEYFNSMELNLILMTEKTFIKDSLLNIFNSNHFIDFLLYSLITIFCFIMLSLLNINLFRQNNRLELPFLYTLVLISAILLLLNLEFFSIFIALECITLTGYVLIGFEREKKFPAFSSLRYLILGSVPTLFLILGFCFFFKSLGLMSGDNLASISFLTYDFSNFYFFSNSFSDFSNIKSDLFLSMSFFDLNQLSFFDNYTISNFSSENKFKFFNVTSPNTFFLKDYYYQDNVILNYIFCGIFFLLINFFFKITLAPFHIWAPSIYTNSPTGSFVFLSLFVKIIIFFLLIIFFIPIFYEFKFFWNFIFLYLGCFSIFVGILGAINEIILKRFIVYSSVGHVGFLILSLSTGDYQNFNLMWNYIIVYILTSLGFWLILFNGINNLKYLTNLKEIINNNNLMKFILVVLMFSMSGIPPMAGFFIKFDILVNLLLTSSLSFSLFILILTIISFFYYLRILKITFFDSVKYYKSVIKLNFEFFESFILSFIVFFISFYMLIYTNNDYIIFHHLTIL